MPQATKDISIIEYHNGKPMHCYDGLQECASNFHCHVELIKGLIFTGQPFPYFEDNITFDLHPDCRCRIERRERSLCKGPRYYLFDVIEDSKKEQSQK